MRAAVRSIATAVTVTLLLSLSPVVLVDAGDIPVCTAEQEANYRPSDTSTISPNCEEVSLKVCTNECLLWRQQDVQHAPNCSATFASRRKRTYRDTAVALLMACEELRVNATDRYIPQIVAGAPPCSSAVSKNFIQDISFSQCAFAVTETCSDECLRTIEEKIAKAPVCTAGGKYTLGETKKYVLMDCLNARKEDRTSNNVLNTVATISDKNAAGSAAQTLTLSTALVSSTFLVLISSLVV